MLLAKNASINVQNKFGYTAISEACYQGHITVVQYLLDHGADLKISTQRSCTPLHLAAIRGRPNIIKLLFDHGANVDPLNNDGDSPLIACCSMKSSGMEACGGRALFTESISLLLQRHADINLKSRTGHTALLFASLNGHLEIVQLLLDHNADIDAVDFQGLSSLHLACSGNHSKIVRLLLRRGANAMLKSRLYSSTALHGAYACKHFESVLELMLTTGGQASAVIKDKQGRLPQENLSEDLRQSFAIRLTRATSYIRRRSGLFLSTKAADASGKNSTMFKRLHDCQLGPWRMVLLFL